MATDDRRSRPDDDPRLGAFSLAVQRLLDERGSKTEVARQMDVPLSTLSSWINGKRAIGVDEAIGLERALGVAPGKLTIHLGWLPPDAGEVRIDSPEEAIIHDDRLAYDQKSILLSTLAQFIRANE